MITVAEKPVSKIGDRIKMIIPFKKRTIIPDNPDNPLDEIPDTMFDMIEGVLNATATHPFTGELVPCETPEDAKKFEHFAVLDRFHLVS